MKLVHFSHTPLGEIVPREQEPTPAYGRFVRKPAGLWVSDESQTESSWSSWCESASFEIGPLAYEVTLRPEHNVLLVGGGDMELEQFHAEFSRENEAPPEAGELGKLVLRGLSDRWIDWQAVAGRWDGIIITPYRWDLRMAHDYLWYYGWDCASGSIWNPEVIAAVTPLNGASL